MDTGCTSEKHLRTTLKTDELIRSNMVTVGSLTAFLGLQHIHYG